MKKLAAIALTLAFCFSITITTTNADDCSCVALDQSCSANASCQGGCTAICRNNGNCKAFCSGQFWYFETEVTLRMQNSSSNKLFTALARISGKDISFSSFGPDELFNLDIKRALLWDVLDTLSTSGSIRIAGEDFEQLKGLRRALLSGEKISICVQNTSVKTLVNDLSNLSGLPIRITAGRASTIVSVKLQNVSLKDILLKVSEQTGTQITNEVVDSAVQ